MDDLVSFPDSPIITDKSAVYIEESLGTRLGMINTGVQAPKTLGIIIRYHMIQRDDFIIIISLLCHNFVSSSILEQASYKKDLYNSHADDY